MRRLFAIVLTITIGSATLLAGNWPQWRGPSLDGVSTETGLPHRWSSTENVAWKLPLPAFSGSTPIIWNDLVFLNVALAARHGTDRAVGRRSQQAGGHLEATALGRQPHRQQAEHVVAVAGHRRHARLGDDRHGRPQGVRLRRARNSGRATSRRTTGTFGIQFGYASSPLLHGDALYVQVLHGMNTDDPSYVLRIDKMTGKTVWRVERPTDAVVESPDSYTTPTLLQLRRQARDRDHRRRQRHRPRSRRRARRSGARTCSIRRTRSNYRIISSPVIAGGLIIAPSRVNPLVAIRPGGSGDVSQIARRLDVPPRPRRAKPRQRRNAPVPRERTGHRLRLDLKTGTPIYGPERLPSDFYSASPVLADGKIYVTGETTGVTTVFRAGPKFEILASNTFGDPCSPYCLSSVAVSQGQLFIKTDANMWVVGKRTK